jgi:SAM-dependent methyltransferase
MIEKNKVASQQDHWENSFRQRKDMFGTEPSYPARKAREALLKEGRRNIIELGGGQGRDTIYFAAEGFQVSVLDYSTEGVTTIKRKANIWGLSRSINVLLHDVRQSLPFDDASFEGCYSHMLYCMALTTVELKFLSREIRRILVSGGLNLYTVRNTNDAHYGAGIHHGEDLWETGGFTVHFFSRDKIMDMAEAMTS